MKTGLMIGIIWTFAAFVLLLLNHRFHQYFGVSGGQGFSHEIVLETKRVKNIAG